MLAQITTITDGFTIAGDITFDTVANLTKQLNNQLLRLSREQQSKQPVAIDFTQVKAANSAALALMIELKKTAVSSKQSLTFTNLPEKLHSLAQVCGVDHIII